MDLASQPLRRVNVEAGPSLFRPAGRLAGFLMRRTTRQDWRPGPGLPPTGGVIVVANHISNFDPVALGHFVVWSGRLPRYLAKRELWDVRLLGWLLRSLGQIPVARNTGTASEALAAAKRALALGQCVIVYPEGTITDDPEGWPMTGLPGAAILALETGCPVVPIGQWGAHEVMGFKKPTFPKLIPRKVMHMAVGSVFGPSRPVARAQRAEAAALTVAYLDEITRLVGQLRGLTPPTDRYDRRVGSRVPQVRQGPQ